MADYVLKPIGDTSWILQDAKQQRLALVSKVNNVLMAVGLDRTEFLEVDDLASYLGHTITVLEPVADTDDDGADELSMYLDSLYDINRCLTHKKVQFLIFLKSKIAESDTLLVILV